MKNEIGLVKEIIYSKNKAIKIEVKKCNFFKKFSGLMFTRREKASALLFEFGKPCRIALHSLFVFFPFIVLWLDDKNKILEMRKVSPWQLRVLPSAKFSKIIEVPLNSKYRRVTAKLSSLGNI